MTSCHFLYAVLKIWKNHIQKPTFNWSVVHVRIIFHVFPFCIEACIQNSSIIIVYNQWTNRLLIFIFKKECYSSKKLHRYWNINDLLVLSSFLDKEDLSLYVVDYKYMWCALPCVALSMFCLFMCSTLCCTIDVLFI